MANEILAVKRRIWAYVLTGIAAAAAAAGSVVTFIYAQYAIGAVLAALGIVFILCLAGEIVQDNVLKKSQNLFYARKFEEEKALLEKVKGNHLLFPFMRERYYLIAIRNALARDDLSLVKSYIDRLRHSFDRVRQVDERHMHYKTSYPYVLFLLDKGEYDAARAEYEDFRTNNEHYAIYQPQIAILNALFERLSGSDAPLPSSIVESPYPVMKRILSRDCNEETVSSDKEQGE